MEEAAKAGKTHEPLDSAAARPQAPAIIRYAHPSGFALVSPIFHASHLPLKTPAGYFTSPEPSREGRPDWVAVTSAGAGEKARRY